MMSTASTVGLVICRVDFDVLSFMIEVPSKKSQCPKILLILKFDYSGCSIADQMIHRHQDMDRCWCSKVEFHLRNIWSW